MDFRRTWTPSGWGLWTWEIQWLGRTQEWRNFTVSCTQGLGKLIASLQKVGRGQGDKTSPENAKGSFLKHPMESFPISQCHPAGHLQGDLRAGCGPLYARWTLCGPLHASEGTCVHCWYLLKSFCQLYHLLTTTEIDKFFFIFLRLTSFITEQLPTTTMFRAKSKMDMVLLVAQLPHPSSDLSKSPSSSIRKVKKAC